ncbi:hypothetical protein M422DRAFT_35133 [Sphaerobolus stellatus SS14]|uniref:DUF6699 domain-containing protein n=1 Tax=Sphaerobolus stellatus (strain SS14) TaxID=990650 RepID=A0A0C9V9Z1_SPHS4|nr:hypothetical protein M422DRAFT_35133 [Sphaerobolus stellatus SS14]
MNVYYTIEGTPFTAAAVPLPTSPYGSPYASPHHSPAGSPYGIHLSPLPPSPARSFSTLPVTGSPRAQHIQLSPLHNPHGLPPALTPTSTVASLAAGTPFKPHPLLEFDAESPKIHWDVRLAPHTARIAKPPFRQLDPYLDQYAIEPAWTFIRLRCDLLPWIVECSNPRGVTVRDILDGVWDCLRVQIDKEDWREASRDFRERLTEVCESRADVIGDLEGRKARLMEDKAGIRRVDWLLWDFEWLGIRKSSDVETWDMFFRSR